MDPIDLHPDSRQSFGPEFKNLQAFVSDLGTAINNQASAIRFYEDLESMAPSQFRDFVTHAKHDEMVHLRMFNKLYRRLTGHAPTVLVSETKFGAYKQGVERAFRDELEAAEMYRNMYLSTRVPKIRDILFRAMTDEMEHAQRFSFLYFLS